MMLNVIIVGDKFIITLENPETGSSGIYADEATVRRQLVYATAGCGELVMEGKSLRVPGR